MMVNGTIPQLDPAIKTGTIHRPNNFTTATVGEISQFDVMSGGGGSDHLNDTEVAFQFDEFLGLAAEIHPDKKTTKEIWSWA